MESLPLEKQNAQENTEGRKQEYKESKKRDLRDSEVFCMVEIMESRLMIIHAIVVGNGLVRAFSKE